MGSSLGPELLAAARSTTRALTSFFRYPVSETLKLLDAGASRAADYGSWFSDSGAEAVEVFFGSPIGRAMAFLGAPDPHRLLSSTPDGYRVCVSWGKRRYRKISKNEAVVEFRFDLLGPAWHAGSFEAGLRRACRVAPTVDLVSRDEAGMNFDLRSRW